MNAKIICLTSKKGGVGKTTSALAVGAGLMQRGKKVLFVDLDSQCNLSNTMRANTTETTVRDVLLEEADARNAVQETSMGDVMAASVKLNNAERDLDETGKEFRLKETLASVLPYYDYVIIDCPPATGILTINALTAAEEAVIPIQADYYSYDGIKQLWTGIERTRKYTNNNLVVAGLLVCRYNARTKLAQSVKHDFEILAEKLGTRVFQKEVRECNALKEAQISHESIYTYAPKCNAVKDYEAVIEEAGWK